MTRQQKITFGEMRASGASRIVVHCRGYKCGHSVTMYPALWPDNVRLSDPDERFVCIVCGHHGADVRPLFEPTRWAQTPCHDEIARRCGFLCSPRETAGYDFVDNQTPSHEACFHKNVER